MTLLLITLSLAIFLATIALAILLPLRPSVLKITQPFVCPKDTHMKIQTTTATYHRDGEKGLIVTCQGQGQTHHVNSRAYLTLWLISFILTLPLALIASLYIVQYI